MKNARMRYLRERFPHLSKQERRDLYALQKARRGLVLLMDRAGDTEDSEEEAVIRSAWCKLGKAARLIMDRNESRA
jgi:hypothetical protein